MAKKGGTWEFDCPQFVDFAAGLDNSDCKDQPSPSFDDVFPSLQTPDVKAKKNLLEKDAENKLIDKMYAALTIIENTPKVTLMKKKYLSENENAKKSCRQLAEKAKCTTAIATTAKIYRSKSVANVNKTGAGRQTKIGLRKRSSSLGDLKTMKKNTHHKVKGLRKRSSSLVDLRAKKHTYPMTPMCLRRTIIKSKLKVIKSTEEMELEEIAKLQKQLKQHLRYNEFSLKKLNLKPRACLNPKVTQIKEENLKEIKVGDKGLKPFWAKLDMEHKEQRRNLHKLNPEALKSEATKLNAIFNNPKRNKTVEKAAKDNRAVMSQNSSVASSTVSDAKAKDNAPLCKKPAVKKIGFHSGLVFHDNTKKNTAFRPFNFNAKGKDQNTVPEKKLDTLPSDSVVNLKVDDSKENMPQRTRPTFNPTQLKGLQYLKNYQVQHPRSIKKTTEKRIGNHVRGLSLSENIARN